MKNFFRRISWTITFMRDGYALQAAWRFADIMIEVVDGK